MSEAAREPPMSVEIALVAVSMTSFMRAVLLIFMLGVNSTTPADKTMALLQATASLSEFAAAMSGRPFDAAALAGVQSVVGTLSPTAGPLGTAMAVTGVIAAIETTCAIMFAIASSAEEALGWLGHAFRNPGETAARFPDL